MAFRASPLWQRVPIEIKAAWPEIFEAKRKFCNCDDFPFSSYKEIVADVGYIRIIFLIDVYYLGSYVNFIDLVYVCIYFSSGKVSK